MLDPESLTAPVAAPRVVGPAVSASALTAIGMALGIIAAVTAPIPFLNFISAGVAFVALVLGRFGLASDHRRNGTGKTRKLDVQAVQSGDHRGLPADAVPVQHGPTSGVSSGRWWKAHPAAARSAESSWSAVLSSLAKVRL